MYRDDFREAEREYYWSAPRVAVGLLLMLLIVYALGFLATGGDLVIYRFWAPKQENARRQVFVNTQSFVQGKIAYLTTLRLSYEAAEAGSPQQKSLRTAILTEAAQVDNDKLPADLRGFIASLKGSF